MRADGWPEARGVNELKARRIFLAALAAALLAGCGDFPFTDDSNSSGLSDRGVEASCGQCQFGLPGGGCELAVRIDGEPYLVDGTGIDDHGNSHAEHGFCNAVRHARVSGRIEDGRFKSKSFAVIPVED